MIIQIIIILAYNILCCDCLYAQNPDLPDNFKSLDFTPIFTDAVGILLNNFVPMVGLGVMVLLQDYARSVELKQKQEARAYRRFERKRDKYFEKNDESFFASLDTIIYNTAEQERREQTEENKYYDWYQDHLDLEDNSYNYYRLERSLEDDEYFREQNKDYY